MHPRVCFKSVTYTDGERTRAYPLVGEQEGPAFIITDDGVRLDRVLVFETDVEPLNDPTYWEGL